MAEQVLCVRCGAPVEGANIYAFPGPRLQHDSPNDCIHALQRALQAERANRPAYLHDPEGTPHCYICGLCGDVEQREDGRWWHPVGEWCKDATAQELDQYWQRLEQKQAGG